MKVFITMFNLLRAIAPLDKKLNINDLYKLSLTVLSIKERERLAMIKEIFENPEMLKVCYKYNKFKNKREYKFVYETSTPSYHVNEKCSKLKADFDNYEIPQEIRNKGESECDKYVKWFSSNVHLLKQIGGYEKFIFSRKLVFNLEDVNIGDVHELNSGSTKVENTELSGLEQNIDDLVKRAMEFKSMPRNRQVIIDYGDKSNVILEDRLSREILNEWHNLKKSIKHNVIQYYMVKFNPNLQFEDTLLEQIGFKKCTSCSAHTVISYNIDDDLPF